MMATRATCKQRRHGVVDAVLVALAAIGIATGMATITPHIAGHIAYQTLSKQATPSEGDSDVGWDALREQNAEMVAWLSVDGTDIDYPVVQVSSDKPSDWYLTHDFWGKNSLAGCPYLDIRSAADGTHLLVYGHHLGLSNLMFSTISDVHHQNRFDSIGSARWNAMNGERADFKPAMAMSVDKSYKRIQKFDFDSISDLQSWLKSMKADASAVSPDLDAMIDGASRVLTLVTCSSPISGQRERTLVIFIA